METTITGEEVLKRILEHPEPDSAAWPVWWQTHLRKEGKVVQGLVLVYTWGWEQTNKDFFLVVRRTPAMATVQKLKAQHYHAGMSMTSTCVPLMGYDPSARPAKFKVKTHGGAEFLSMAHGLCRPWGGSPEHATHYA